MSEAKHKLLQPHLPDTLTVRHWFVFYGLYLLVMSVIAAVLVHETSPSLETWVDRPAETFAAMGAAFKLTGYTLYCSLCSTFIPLPTGWLVAATATRESALAAGMADSDTLVALYTTGLLALFGAIGSTIANLNDYHVFTWLLRHQRVAAMRNTRSFMAAERWFSRSPFMLLVLFNIIPIPFDLVRMLAISYRYPRVPYAVSNFIGRFIRYAIIAWVTYRFDLGWIASVALLGFAAAMGLGRLLLHLVQKFF